MSMSRDGLLPKKFSVLHPRFKTPAFATIITGIIVAVPSLFMNLTEVTDLTSIGTLFAFVLVSGGVLIMDNKQRGNTLHVKNSYRVPYFNSRFILPVVWILVLIVLLFFNIEGVMNFFDFNHSKYNESFWEVFKHQIPMLGFIIFAVVITYFAVAKQFSFIPVAGLLTNLYLMTELGITNWLRFLIWLAIGLLLYFLFGIKHSKLNNENRN